MDLMRIFNLIDDILMAWDLSGLAILMYGILVIGCVVRVLYRQKSTGVTFAWLIILFVFPLVGVVLYFMFGESRLGFDRQKRSRQVQMLYQEFGKTHLAKYMVHLQPKNQAYQDIEQLAMSESSFGATAGNDMTLLTTTDDIIHHMIADIDNAQHLCLLSFYIIEPDGKIARLLEALMRASARGVDCLILADAVGSRQFFKSVWVARLKNAGVVVHQSLPVGFIRTFFTRMDLRNHRKLLIIDKQIGYTGSFNLIDPKYFKADSGVGEWVDVMMRCTGSVVLEMVAVLYADVAVENDDNLHIVKERLLSLMQNDTHLPDVIMTAQHVGDITAQVVPSGPDQSENAIYRTIIHALHIAKERITITTPYFVPDEPLLLAMTSAAKRGVNVTLIVPKDVDSRLVKYTSRAYFPMLMKNGVHIAQFYGGLLHAKTLVIDDCLCLFGTVNMDMRSFFLNLEITLAIYDKDMTAQIIAQQNAYLKQSETVCITSWQERSSWWGLVENTARLFSPLL